MSSGIWCECPENDLILPCLCLSVDDLFPDNKAIRCYNLNDDNQLPQIMDNLNNSSSAPKHYKRLDLFNTGIQELKENTLKGITFDEIHIMRCENLTTIHENAFILTENVTKVINLSNNPKLTFENSSIFNLLKKFINVELIVLNDNEDENDPMIIEIPTNAFARSLTMELENIPFNDSHHNNNVQDIPPRELRSSVMNKLKFLKIGPSFTKINSYAFASLDNLEVLYFYMNKFETIPENAFTFDHASNKSFVLRFDFKNDTNGFLISEKSLLNINRPTELYLDSKEIPESEKYLEERIYLPFLLDNPKNTVKTCFNGTNISPGDGLNCSDPRNHWFTNNNDLVQRVTFCDENLNNLSC